MKTTLIVALVALMAVPMYTISLSNEFITGFESGIFLRQSPSMLDDYGCPKARTNI